MPAKKAQYTYPREDPYPDLPELGMPTPHSRTEKKSIFPPTSRSHKPTREVQPNLSARGIGPSSKKKDEYLERKGVGPSRGPYIQPEARRDDDDRDERDKFLKDFNRQLVEGADAEARERRDKRRGKNLWDFQPRRNKDM